MEIIDFYIDYLEALDFNKSRLSRPEKPFVLFFGGQVSGDNESVWFDELNEKKFLSIRSLLKRISLQDPLLEYNFLTPEEINWEQGAVFKDILEFEISLSYFSPNIVIITETPGALVELGVFCSNNESKNKLLVMAESKFSDSNSFINKGVFENIRRNNNNALYFHSIKSYSDNIHGYQQKLSIPKESAEDLYYYIKTFIAETQKTYSFKVSNKSHLFSLLIDVMSLFRMLSEKELITIAEYTNMHLEEEVFSQDDIRQFLLLTKALDLVCLYTQGTHRFFYLNTDIKSLSKFQYSCKENVIYDKKRAKNKIHEFYSENSITERIEKYRLQAINKIFQHNDIPSFF